MDNVTSHPKKECARVTDSFKIAIPTGEMSNASGGGIAQGSESTRSDGVALDGRKLPKTESEENGDSTAQEERNAVQEVQGSESTRSDGVASDGRKLPKIESEENGDSTAQEERNAVQDIMDASWRLLYEQDASCRLLYEHRLLQLIENNSDKEIILSQLPEAYHSSFAFELDHQKLGYRKLKSMLFNSWM